MTATPAHVIIEARKSSIRCVRCGTNEKLERPIKGSALLERTENFLAAHSKCVDPDLFDDDEEADEPRARSSNDPMMWDRPCFGCPFTASSIVSTERVRDVIDTCTVKDCHFTCHKDAEGNVDAGTKQVLCRGYYDTLYKKTGVGQYTRIVERFGGFKVVPIPPEKDAEARTQLTPFRKARRPK